MKKKAEIEVRMKIFGNRVLVIPDPPDTKTKSGLFIPDNAVEPKIEGTVVALGKLCKEAIPEARILFGKGAGAPITIHGFNYLVMREAEIILDITDPTNIRVFDDRVLIVADDEANKSKLGLFIPENAKEPVTSGLVVNHGINCKDTVDLTRVLFGKHAGKIIRVGELSYLILRESDIVAEL